MMATTTGSNLERASVGGFTLAYRDAGEGPPCVLLHGFPFDHTQWREQVPALTDHARLILPDLRGHGASDAPPPPYRMLDFADDVRALLDRLELERVVLGGLSMGGYIALACAERYPERLRGLILMATRAEADTETARALRMETVRQVQTGGAEAITAGMLERLLGQREVPAAISRSVRDMILGTSIDGLTGSLIGMASRPDSTPRLSSITCPTLVIVGAEDDLTPPECARAMANAIPDAELVVVPGAGHLVPLEQPSIVNRNLRGFLARCDT